eukprot:UN18775
MFQLIELPGLNFAIKALKTITFRAETESSKQKWVSELKIILEEVTKTEGYKLFRGLGKSRRHRKAAQQNISKVDACCCEDVTQTNKLCIISKTKT